MGTQTTQTPLLNTAIPQDPATITFPIHVPIEARPTDVNVTKVLDAQQVWNNVGLRFPNSQTLSAGGTILYPKDDPNALVYSFGADHAQFAVLANDLNSATSVTSLTSAAERTTTQASHTGNSNDTSLNTSSPSATNPTTSNSSGGLSNGAVAGVAIGCLAAGALIAGALAFLCFRKRKSTKARDSEASSVALMHNEKGAKANVIPLSSGSPNTGAMESGLPQPLEDKAISGEVSKISNLIKNHVQSYYHTGRVNPGAVDYDDIQALGHELPVSVGTLSTLLSNSATREIALRFCIAWVIIPRMQITDSPRTTFLPPEVSECFQGMSLVDRGSQVHAMFFAKWRAITAELMQSTYVRNPFSGSDLRLQNIHEAANVLDNVLRPYSDSRMEDVQRTRNLEEILKRAALFAFTLFSQPSTWDFDWENEQGVKSGSLCIFPSLVQVADERGEPVKPPRPFSEAVVRRLDE